MTSTATRRVRFSISVRSVCHLSPGIVARSSRNYWLQVSVSSKGTIQKCRVKLTVHLSVTVDRLKVGTGRNCPTAINWDVSAQFLKKKKKKALGKKRRGYKRKSCDFIILSSLKILYSYLILLSKRLDSEIHGNSQMMYHSIERKKNFYLRSFSLSLCAQPFISYFIVSTIQVTQMLYAYTILCARLVCVTHIPNLICATIDLIIRPPFLPSPFLSPFSSVIRSYYAL